LVLTSLPRRPSRLLALFLPLRRRPLCSTLFPYTTLFRSHVVQPLGPRLEAGHDEGDAAGGEASLGPGEPGGHGRLGHQEQAGDEDRKSTRLNSSHVSISYAVFCLKKKTADTRSNGTHIAT